MSEPFWFPDFEPCKELLRARLTDPAPGRIQLLTGPRQVGKTTLLLELAEEIGPRAIYVACDGPEASLSGWWERLWATVEDAAAREEAIVFLDEVERIPDWSTLLKAQWDRIRRRKRPIHIVATGSSALRVGAGARESLAGRFERITLTHWSASALAGAFDLAPADAVDELVRHGGYPGAAVYRNEPQRWRAYVRDAIVEPAIGRDVLALGQVRKPALLRQLFAVCTSAPAQIVSLQKLQGALGEKGALETVAHYLALLYDAYLVAPLQKHTSRPMRRRAAPPKLIVLSNALLAAADPRGIPDSAADPARYGVWVENACLAHALNSGQQVAYWREEPYEVDAIIEGSWGSWAVEIKTGAFTESDLRALAEFTTRYPAYRPLVLAPKGALGAAARAGFAAMPWQDFLLKGIPSGGP